MSPFLALACKEWGDTAELLQPLLERQQHNIAGGDGPRWQACIDQLPALKADCVDCSVDCLRIGSAEQLSAQEQKELKDSLMGLHPWRKGPYNLFGTHIDCEWRSDWKWQRLADKISDLSDRRVLDVGCGNGYHMWRMRAAGARAVFGIDPMLLFLMQFRALAAYINDEQVQVLQCTLEDWPQQVGAFDTVFSMGVYYHRRDPLDHLRRLQALLRSGGELVLETLVITGDGQAVLRPEGRYAKMRNVYTIPSALWLRAQLIDAGWQDVAIIDECVTSIEEQRRTEWMHFESLPDFLDPADSSRTVEGHPAPRRAVLRATRP